MTAHDLRLDSKAQSAIGREHGVICDVIDYEGPRKTALAILNRFMTA